MIIGLCGPAGAGKDTTADFLVKNHGFVKVAFADPLKRICQDVYQFTDAQLWGPSEMRNAPDRRYPRTETAREFIARVNESWDAAILKEFGAEAGQHFLTTRHALQQLGTEWGRACYPNTWVDYALRIAKRLQEGGCYYDAKSGLRTLSYVDDSGPDDVALVHSRKDVAISDVRFKNEVDAIHAAGGKVIRLWRESTLQGAAAQHRSEQEQLGFTNDMFDFNIENTGPLHSLERLTEMALKEFLGKSPA